MDTLLTVFLPLSLAIIMLSLGIGLTVADFSRVLARPKAFLAGGLAQIILLPVVAYGVILAFGLSRELAVGMMLLAFCPGGVTSNILSKFAKGDVALSVSLTGVISVLSILTVPALTAWAMVHFMGTEAPPVNITRLAIAVFIITTVPVAIGVAIRHFAPGFAGKVDKPLSVLAGVLFLVIVIGAVATNWDLFITNLASLGPALITLNIVLLAMGWMIGKAFSQDHASTTTISIETGIQNSTLGITLGSLLVEQASGFPPFSLPSGVYGITMYLVAAPFIFWSRRKR